MHYYVAQITLSQTGNELRSVAKLVELHGNVMGFVAQVYEPQCTHVYLSFI